MGGGAKKKGGKGRGGCVRESRIDQRGRGWVGFCTDLELGRLTDDRKLEFRAPCDSKTAFA